LLRKVRRRNATSKIRIRKESVASVVDKEDNGEVRLANAEDPVDNEDPKVDRGQMRTRSKEDRLDRVVEVAVAKEEVDSAITRYLRPPTTSRSTSSTFC
jgi:hypothetical protein